MKRRTLNRLDPSLGVPRRMTIVSWDGELPAIGDYMLSSGGTVYLVTDLRRCRPSAKSLARLGLLKFPKSVILPEGQDAHQFAWNARSRAAA